MKTFCSSPERVEPNGRKKQGFRREEGGREDVTGVGMLACLPPNAIDPSVITAFLQKLPV
jgi:hypothetical protein